MATAPTAHVGLWGEDDLLKLPDDGQRYELVEGALHVNPPPSLLHQVVSLRVASLLLAACPPGLEVVEASGVRLGEGTMLIPDVVVEQRAAMRAANSGIVDASVVRLVVEIVSPSSRTTDRVTKPALCAGAGIASYWRVELDGGPVVHAYRLEGDAYVPVGSVAPGERFEVEEPFPVAFDPEALQR